MAKIIFSEVRTKSKLYNALSRELIKKGHEVTWIVQNHLFKPVNYSKLYLLKYPSHEEVKEYKNKNVDSEILDKVKKSDRMILYFGKGASHYHYYYVQIGKILTKENPDIIFGELGNFHTHMLCLIAKKMGIKYYDFETARYPKKRFSFHLYDKYFPIKVNNYSEDSFSRDRIDEFILGLKERKVIPDYMQKERKVNLKKLFSSIWYRFKLFKEYVRGERFATVSPIIFLKRKIALKLLYQKYNKKCLNLSSITREKEKGKNILLYPMQMQPEFNLDVWGVNYRNQSLLIQNISDNLPKGWHLVIKLNPKYREDLTEETLSIIKEKKNISLLDPKVGMKPINDVCDCVISVTGTVVLERLFKREPVIGLGDTFLKKLGYLETIDNFEELKKLLENPNNLIINQVEPDKLFVELLNRSVPGWITEPITNPKVLDVTNIDSIVKGIEKVLNEV